MFILQCFNVPPQFIQRRADIVQRIPRFRHISFDGQSAQVASVALIQHDGSFNQQPHLAERIARHPQIMAYLGLTDKPREGQDALAEHPLENYQKTSFSMYGGDVKHVTLRVSNWMMGAIIDKFGRQNYAHPLDDRHFEVTVPVAVSPQFYGWVFGLKNYVTITAQQDVVEGMEAHLRAVMKRYE